MIKTYLKYLILLFLLSCNKNLDNNKEGNNKIISKGIKKEKQKDKLRSQKSIKPKAEDFVPLYKISKPGIKDSHIYFTAHTIHSYEVPSIVEETIKNYKNFYFEVSPYHYIFKFIYGAYILFDNFYYDVINNTKKPKIFDEPDLKQVFPKLKKDIEFREFFKKIYPYCKEIIDIAVDYNTSIKYKKYCKNHLLYNLNYLFDSSITKYIYPNKVNYKCIENEIFKIALKYGINKISSLDDTSVNENLLKTKYINARKKFDPNFNGKEAQKLSLNNIIKDKNVKFYFYSNFANIIEKDLYKSFLKYKSKDHKKYFPENLLEELYYTGYFREALLSNDNQHNRTSKRNINWIKNTILKNPGSFYAAGAGHFVDYKENSLKSLLEKEGYTITHVYSEKVINEVKQKLKKANDLKSCKEATKNTFLKLYFNPYSKVKISKLEAEKLEDILKKSKRNKLSIQKRINQMYYYAQENLKSARKQNPFFVTEKDYKEQLKYFENKLKGVDTSKIH